MPTDASLLAAHRGGDSYAVIAQKFGLSVTGVTQSEKGAA